MTDYEPEYDTGASSDSGLGGLPTRAAGWGRDTFERVIATIAEAGIAFATVEVADLPVVWVPIGTAILALVKSFVAKYVGNSDSASLDPAVKPVIVS
jgi:hypothetical protein